MKKFLLFIAVFMLITLENLTAQEVVTVAHFERVIVSPYIEVTFTAGDKESVTILNSTVTRDKVNIESNGNTLRVYLDGAKEIPKNEKVNEEGRNIKKPIYNGTVLTLVITYKTLNDLSVRGGETILLKSKLDQERFNLVVYGESTINFDEVQLQEMHTTIYGESSVELKSGSIAEQKFTAYGESKVNALGIKNSITKATLYGQSELNLNVSDQIRVTAFGDSKIGYKGTPEIKRGIAIGNVKIYQIN